MAKTKKTVGKIKDAVKKAVKDRKPGKKQPGEKRRGGR